MSSLYLATKCEEENVHIARIIRCFYLIFLQRQHMDLKYLDNESPV